ncbi:MAG: universal stress protein [Candidatus Dormibacteria bacterium]
MMRAHEDVVVAPGTEHILERISGKLLKRHGGAHSVHPNEDLLQLNVRKHVADLKAAGLDVEVHMQSTIGKAAESIAEMVRECHADLIVAGATKHGPLADLVFGTAGQRMYRLAPCPVLVPAQN